MSKGKKELDKEDHKQDAGKSAEDSPSGLTRRRFLSLSMLVGCAAIGLPSDTHASTEFKGWPDSYGMLTDLTACVGCRSCERACNEANKMPPPQVPFDDGAVFKEHRWPSSKALTVVNQYNNPSDSSRPVYRKIQCNHCLEPACATACPIHAYSKTAEGAVTYNPDLCFGCRYCVISCPFNMPAYDYDSAFEPKIIKCFFCYDRIKEGKLTACADACPAGALTFGKRKDILKLARKRINDNPKKYIDHIYGENEVGGTSWLYISSVPFDLLGFPGNLPSKPLIELSRGFLSSVPIIFTTFPALFGMVYALTRHRNEEGKEGDKKKKEVNNE